ncbi:methyltransferase domain-containing protein [Candidatus Micrarchaeota archaeon]|nr:methyltransferase domain-containing protein [Candidatus Micrarchaeota archaeon]
MEIYDEMARRYDLIYGDLADLEYYMNEARNARGKVLEVGCGTGRILLHLLEEGIDAQGLDSSPEMLAVLKEKAEKKGLEPRVSCADMLDFSLDDRFQLIILPYRTFLHLKNKSDMEKALLNLKKHLEPGGRLILHVYKPLEEDLSMQGEYHHFETEHLETPEGERYTIDWHLQYEPVGRMAHYRVVLRLAGGEKHTYEMDIHLVKMKELGEMLKECGYKNIKAYWGFDYIPFKGEPGEVVWIAEN